MFTPDVDSTRDDLQAETQRRGGEVRLVSHDLYRLPPHSELLDRLLHSLADAALLLWPDWYDGSLANDGEVGAAEQFNAERLALERLSRTHNAFNLAWAKAAMRECRRGGAPSLSQFSTAFQVRQLALALASEEILLGVCLTERSPSSGRLLGLARALEWLAREADAPVVAVLPTELEHRNELDGVNSNAVCLEPQDATGQDDAVGPVEANPERTHVVSPILGRPHPASPGEQLLAARLERDSELAGLFGFNQRVTCFSGNGYLVDLLWRAGRVVVEVDGYGCHSSRSSFNGDRHRDSELTLSGYIALRLPHAFVVQDPELATERIREFVHFRQKHPFHNEASA